MHDIKREEEYNIMATPGEKLYPTDRTIYDEQYRLVKSVIHSIKNGIEDYIANSNTGDPSKLF